MAWTNPATWITGAKLLASQLNTHLRDNLNETAPAKVTTKGDIVAATGANAIARVAAGADYTVPAALASEAAGVQFMDISTILAQSGVLADLSDVDSAAPSDGQVLTWDNANSWWEPATPSNPVTTVVKAADESVTSSTTAQADDELSFSVTAGTTYAFRAVLFVQGGTGDFKLHFTMGNASGSTMRWGAAGPADNISSTMIGDGDWHSEATFATTVNYGTSGSVPATVQVSGILIAGATTTFQLWWAQKTSSTDATTVLAKSHIVHHVV